MPASRWFPAACGRAGGLAIGKGHLKAGPAELRLRLHVKADRDGGLSATFDSVDQGAMGMPVSRIESKDGALTFGLDQVKGRFEGKFDAGGKIIRGTWYQGGTSLPLEFRPFTAPATAVIDPGVVEIAGDWFGKLDARVQTLRLVLHIGKTGSSTLDSLDQAANGIPVSDITRQDRKVSFLVRAVGGKFAGELDATLRKLSGTWTQGGVDMPLVFERMKEGETVEAPKRPQMPVKPYPYDERQVEFVNPSAPDVRLAGTLTTPRGDGPFPVIVTITGSGPQDRDESLLGHKPFLVIADYLTRHGIAVLRYDDRGFEKSTGNFATATSADFATDAEAAVDFLKTQPKIEARRIGLLGHSEGGLVAPMVAARRPDVAFLVLLAPTSVTGAKILVGQGAAIMAAMGKPMSPEASKLSAEIYDAVLQGASDADLEKKIRAALAASTGTEPGPEMVAMQMKTVTSPWFRFFLGYDPAKALEKVKCPVLALFGEKDLQVLPADNVEPLKAALGRAGNKQVTVKVVPGANHLFQQAQKGTVDEYARIEETINPDVLKTISAWVAATTK